MSAVLLFALPKFEKGEKKCGSGCENQRFFVSLLQLRIFNSKDKTLW